MSMTVLGFDIGGANLKVATSCGQARSEPFEIWRAPHELFSSVQQLVDRLALPGAIDPPTTSGQCA